MGGKNKIPDAAAAKGNVGLIPEIEAKLAGYDRRSESPHINLKYIQTDYECFSDWTDDELKEFSSFIRKLNQTNWNDIFKSGGTSGGKSGFGYTQHKDRKALPKTTVLDSISKEITFFELRVNSKVRVHGFRSNSAFFLLWLDREHRIYPS